jgi:hypothetical protein
VGFDVKEWLTRKVLDLDDYILLVYARYECKCSGCNKGTCAPPSPCPLRPGVNRVGKPLC